MPSFSDVYASVKLDLDKEEEAKLKRRLGKIDTKDAGRRMGAGLSKNLGGGFRAGIAGTARTMFAPIAAAAAAVGGFALFKGFIADAAESAKISRLTAQVIESTGGAANVTAEQVNKLATALSNKTGVDDELVQTGSNLILTFKNIRNEVGKGNKIFDRATAAALDLSAAGFGDVTATSKQLGKALNDPLKGLTALGRAGVTFTEQQKEQIKTLVEAGDVLGAQKIILAEVESQVGGAAAAAADPLDKLKVIVGNLGEEIGAKMLPFVERAATWLGENLPKALEAVTGFMSREVMPRLREFGDFFKAEILPRLQEFGGFIRDEVVPRLVDLGGWISKNRDFFIPFVALLGAAVAGFKAFMFIKTVTTAVAAFNAMLLANPIGLVVAAIAALAAGLIYAYKNSETFRDIVDGVFSFIADAADSFWNGFLKPIFDAFGAAIEWIGETAENLKILWDLSWEEMKSTVMDGVRFIVDGFLGFVDTILQGAEEAFGWVPKVGDKLDDAHDAFEDFRREVNEELGGIKDKSITITGTADIQTHGKAVYVNGVRVAGTAYAEGGLWNHENHVAQVAKGGSWRIWAEDETGGEAYIPLSPNKRGRSLKVLETVAHMFGYNLMQAANGAIFDVKTSLPTRPWQDMASRFNRDATAVGYAMALMAQAATGYSPGLAGALSWARSQAGKPYLWGGVGPNGYDCSGFLSAITNVIQGRSPYSRRFSTGTLPAGLFEPGRGPFTVGWFRGNPGHTAGTLNGVNVESAGGVGVRVGRGARGAGDSMFNGPWRLRGFDSGGWLQPGWTMAYNGTGSPERVVAPHQEGGANIYVEVSGRDARVPELAHALRRIAQLEARDVLNEYLQHQSRGGRA